MNLYFFTATILERKHLLKPDKYKEIIIESFKFLVKKKRVRIFAFIIMRNLMNLVRQINEDLMKSNVQRDCLKYISQTIKRDLERNQPSVLKNFYAGAKDRKYHFWERDLLSVILVSQKVTEQKINYIHNNSIHPKWKLAQEPQDYKYSSAKFYYEGIYEFGFLENYMEVRTVVGGWSNTTDGGK